MRLRFVFGCLVLALAFGPAAAAQVFPDLPGMSAAEGLAEVPEAPEAPEEGDDATEDEGAVQEEAAVVVSAGDTEEDASAEDATLADSINELPGMGILPISLDSSEAAQAGGSLASAAPLALLALAVVVLFTRFLVRLNSVR
jgi:hypothetical protein